MTTTRKIVMSAAIVVVVSVGIYWDKKTFVQEAVLTPHQQAEIATAKAIKLAHRIATRIDYLKDPRTNLCFAFLDSHGGPALASVPCTPQVEERIQAGLQRHEQ